MVPNFIGIGAPKAGTTWLFHCLQEHPQVFVAAVKETNFFDYATIEGRLAEYEPHFANSEGARAVGEVSTRYLASERAPGRVRQVIPEARLVVSLRNPIDQTYSHYWHLLRQNFHQWDRRKVPRSFEEALEQYEEKLLAPCSYHRHLQRWLQHFDRRQLLILFYDDIRTNPGQVLRTVYSFLGVEAAFSAPSTHRKGTAVRAGTSPRSPMLGRIHSRLYDRLNRRVYYPLKRLLGPRAASRLKDTLRVRQIMESAFQRTGYPPMRPHVRHVLRDRFAEQISRLETLTGRDLSGWA